MPPTIRGLTDADVAPVVALSLTAWAPVFASLEAELGSAVFRLLFPDWRSAQTRTVETVCRAPEHDVWVAEVGGQPVGFIPTDPKADLPATDGASHGDPGEDLGVAAAQTSFRRLVPDAAAAIT